MMVSTSTKNPGTVRVVGPSVLISIRIVTFIHEVGSERRIPEWKRLYYDRKMVYPRT